MIKVDATKRAGRMIQAGRVTVTFRNPLSGKHITLLAKCRGKVNERWQSVPLAEAQVIFVEVPSQGGWNDKVGKINRSGFFPDRNADHARVWCAKQLLLFLAGEPMYPGLEAFEESHCGRCGRALTDPVSIERGIGPECYGKVTGSKHETKTRGAATEPAAPSEPRTPSLRQEVGAKTWDEASDLERCQAMHGIGPFETAHEQAEADGTHEYAQEEIRRDQLAFEADLESQVDRAASAEPSGDGLDKKGVPLGAGDWRGRQRYLSAARSDQAPKRVIKGLQMQGELPGTTFEDIFGGPTA